jgi:iron-sulfur cluster repair protein YtfE (RIC family)
MLATDVLKNNHKAILELFDRAQRTGRGNYGLKKELFQQIKRALRTHLSLEEEMLYPAMIRKPSPSAARRLDGVLREHLVIDDLLTSLSSLQPQDREFDSSLRELRWRVEQHLHLEEHGPYDEIRRSMKRRALEKLGALIRARIDLLSRAAVPLS